MKKRPENKQVDEGISKAAVPARLVPLQRVREGLGGAKGAVNKSVEAALGVLYNYTTLTTQAIREGGAVNQRKANRPVKPSETIDNDVSSAAVFVVAIMLMLIVSISLFFAISSSFSGLIGS